ncbi:MAG TPA: hypothetical protein VIY48_04505 [Candidatus Paceibacterota bacterium]
MTQLLVPLVAHFTGHDGINRAGSLRVAFINEAGTPFVVYNSRLASAYGIKDPDFKFSCLAYAEPEDAGELNWQKAAPVKVAKAKKPDKAEPDKAE